MIVCCCFISNMGLTYSAQHLEVAKAVEKCHEYLNEPGFNVQRYCYVIMVADQHGLKDLKEAADIKMASMYEEICEKEEFLSDMSADLLSALLCRDDLSAPSEDFVFKSVMQWIKYKKEERLDVAAKVIGAVRLGLVDSKDVIEELDTEEMQAIPEIHMLLHTKVLRNCRRSSSSAFALEEARPRSMSSVGKSVFLVLSFTLHVISAINMLLQRTLKLLNIQPEAFEEFRVRIGEGETKIDEFGRRKSLSCSLHENVACVDEFNYFLSIIGAVFSLCLSRNATLFPPVSQTFPK